MYKKRRSSGFSLFRIIILGILIGVGFMVYDGWQNSQNNTQSPPEQISINTDTQTQSSVDPQNTTSIDTNSQVTLPDVISNARIVIPEIAVSAEITTAYLDGTSWDVSRLGNSVGHLQGTAWFGDFVGNIVLSGHVELSDGRQGVFAPIVDLSAGDIIQVFENDEERTYMVVDVYQVEPQDLEPLYPTDFERLTLITCGGYDFFSDSYQIRTVVVADRLS